MSLRRIALTVGAAPVGTAYTWSYPNSDGKVYVVPTYGLTVVGKDASGIEVRRVFEALRFGVHRTIGNTRRESWDSAPITDTSYAGGSPRTRSTAFHPARMVRGRYTATT